MVFNSVTYIIFLVSVVIIYHTLPRALKLHFLFISSIAFYAMWRVDFALLVVAVLLVSYFSGRLIESECSNRRKLVLLASTVSANISLLIFFKYTYFILENTNHITEHFSQTKISIPFDIILPLGISFYTFQAISYVVDVYRGVHHAEKNFFLVGTYIIFFPQLIAGPILRAGDVIWQLAKKTTLNVELLERGFRRILYGLFLKVCLADQIGMWVDRAFSNAPSVFGAFDVWALAWLFGFQIYFDFSAYSHIAIGTALLFGIKFPENFHFPYTSSSPKEFWQRWHISLSTWVRDYVYLPICYFRKKNVPVDRRGMAENDTVLSSANRNITLFSTFLLMGIWHGAAWTFVIWGIWQAVLVIIYRALTILGPSLPTLSKGVRVSIFLPLIMLGWIPFRAPSVDYAITMLSKTVQPSQYFPSLFGGETRPGISGLLNASLAPDYFLIAFIVTAGFFCVYIWNKYVFAHKHSYYKLYCVFDIIFITTLFFLTFIYFQPIDMFIYFQF